MDLKFTTEEEAFRVEVREWIGQNLPEAYKGGESKSPREDRVEWYKRLAERGWLCPSWPEEYGGTGWSLAKQYIFREEVGMLGAPRGDMGVSMIGPLICEFGNDAQKARYLPKITAAEELWCQGYSEPNAGSDLASLSLRAVRDGDEYVVNGQKIWTSSADESDMIFFLSRTDNTAKKRQSGISFMVAPLSTPGIEIRPIQQITGESHFFETFFTDARVPVENLLGEENAGWALAKRLLAHERNSSGSADGYRKSLGELKALAHVAGPDGQRPVDDSTTRQRLAQLHMELDSLRALGFRGLTKLLRGEAPGTESSIMKLYGSELFQRICDSGMELEGPLSQLWEDGGEGGGWPKTSTWSRAYTIFGGTSEIQRNIISERVLGLPRD